MKYVIIGNNIYAVMMKKYIESTTDKRVSAFAVDDGYVNTEVLENLPVISFSNLFSDFSLTKTHDTTVGNFSTFAGRSTTGGCVQIDDNCFLGVGSGTKDNIKLGDHTLLGAMAYGFKNTKPYSIIKSAQCELIEGKSLEYL